MIHGDELDENSNGTEHILYDSKWNYADQISA